MSARRRVVVVGAGSSGSVVAARLARSERDDVVLLEAGPGDADAEHLDVTRLPLHAGSPRVVVHRSTDGLDLPRGFGLGGSSVVNGGYYLRWHPDDFGGWDPVHWPAAEIERQYRRLDGGDEGGGVMSVRRIDDVALHPWSAAFERHWRRRGVEEVSGAWPRPGLLRVRSNSVRDDSRRGARVSAFTAHLGADRPRPEIRTDSPVDTIEVSAGRVRAVRAAGERIAADEVVLCAGGLASAALLTRSGLAADRHPLAEHRELLVRFDPAGDSGALPASEVLQTVVHTHDGLEIRCYTADFADLITGVPRTGAAVGIAAMRPGSRGTLSVRDTGVDVDLGALDPSTTARVRALADVVAAMLDGPDHAGLVRPGSIRIDSALGTSHHAWGTLPMGRAVDWCGRVRGVEGLRVADASILPGAGSSGNHETVMMVAGHIADDLADTA